MAIIKKGAEAAVANTPSQGISDAMTKCKAELPKTEPVDTESYYVKNGYGRPMSQYEIDLDKRIQRSGAYQAAATSPALGTMPWKKQEDLHKAIDDLAKFLLTKINE